MQLPWSKKPKVVEPYVYIAGNPPLPLSSNIIGTPNLVSTSPTVPPPATSLLNTAASLQAVPSLGVSSDVAQPTPIADASTVPTSFGGGPSAVGNSAVSEEAAILTGTTDESSNLDPTNKTDVNSPGGSGGANFWSDSSSDDQATATQPVATEGNQTQNPLNHLGGPSVN